MEPGSEPQLDLSQETETLVKRLAGPSSGKAGLALDQTEINRIIADASKGSKFYDNEKRKDKELTERINRIKKEKDESMRGVDIRKVEAAVDQLLVQLEAQRDLSQIIVHVDMDAFFASVELLYNPELAGKPFGVGRGVLTTASYEARKYGVRSGMPGFIAKKLCPDLILVSNNFSRYSEMSAKVMDIFRRYDPNMCPAGSDEAYLNITEYSVRHGLTAEVCVQEMRKAVHAITQLTVSAGIAPNKMLAKICSDKNKPNGQFQIPFDSASIKAFMHHLSIRKVPGIGRVNERLLESIGIKTCGDIYMHRVVISAMDKRFGLKFLLQTHLGIASNIVEPHLREERKSIGAERTFSSLGDKEKILQKLQEIAAELEKDMSRNGWTGRTVTLKYKLDTYQVFTRAKTFDRYVFTKEELYLTGKELILPELPLKLRLIGLRLTKLKDLRHSSDEGSGIKRFFTPLKHELPNKKLRLDDDVLPSLTTESETSNLETQDRYDESMPGFHEHDETDAMIPDEDDDNDELENLEVLTTTTHTTTTPAPNADINNTGSINATVQVKPYPTGEAASSRVEWEDKVNTSKETHECPVCGKTLETDNKGLNSHIDFCLSRGAIWKAQAEARSPAPKPKPKSWQWGNLGKGQGEKLDSTRNTGKRKAME